MGNINNSEDIINILFDCVQKNFDNFGHQGDDWWWKTDFGGSWSPFVETFFMLEGKKDGKRHKILCCYSHKRITEYISTFFSDRFLPDFKYPCRNIDVAWLDQKNIYFLVIEHSEDTPSKKMEIQQMEYLLNYLDEEDKDVVGKTAIKQLLAVRDEINKLKGIKSRFKVLISRPRRFRKIRENGNWRNTPSYLDSVNHFKKQIEKDLRKDVESFNDNETWVIILIAPEHGSNGFRNDKIIFYCYEWVGKNEGRNLSDRGKKSIQIKEENGRWVKVPSE